MAISRPLLLALLGVALLGATFVAVQGARDTGTAGTAAAPSAQSQAAGGLKPAAQLSAGDTLQSAFSFDALKSARFDGALEISAKGQAPGKLELAGRFQRGGPKDMPKLDLHVQVHGIGSKLDLGFVSTGDHAYLVNDGTGYKLPDEIWSQALSARSQGASPATGATGVAAPTGAKPAVTLASLGLHPQSWIKDAKVEGTEQVDGVQTQHASASLDADKALGDISKLARQAGQAGALPKASELKRGDFDVWVGKDDRIVRRMTADVEASGAKVHFDLQLSEVNDPQTIEAPAKVSDSLPAGIFGGAAAGFSSGFSLATGADASALALPSNHNPKRLARAIDDHRKVLLFFAQPHGLDDKATAESVREAARRTHALVLKDDVRNSKRYGKLVENLGVNQAPAIVIVDRKGDARLLEGYIDGGSLVQELSDAR
jgi:hypothetical protein